MKQILKILLFNIILTNILIAEQSPISITSSVDKANVKIGDLIEYTVRVIHDEAVQIQMPGHGANLGGFQIREYNVEKPRKEEGQIVSEAVYTIATFFVGEFDIPPLTIYYQFPGDTIHQSLTTEKIHIVVESLKASEAGDIREVKPPLEIERGWWILWRWIFLGLFILLGGLIAYIIYRRKKSGKRIIPIREEPPRPPHEIALEALQTLKESDFLESGQIKEYYIQISEIIRQYIGGRYFVVAMEMTTTEVLSGLKKEELSVEHFEMFEAFLHRCDLVKFAKYIPTDQEHEATFQMAMDLVNQTQLYAIQNEIESNASNIEEETEKILQNEAKEDES